jgi:hypothetical protein
MKNGFRRILSILMLMFVGLGAAHAAEMSAEEKTVRLAYARLVFGAELGALHQAVSMNSLRKAKHEEQWAASQIMAQVEEERLRFELSNFKVGSLADLGNVTYREMVTQPTGDQEGLSVADGGMNYREFKNDPIFEHYFRVSWGHWISTQENWNIPAKDVFDRMENHSWYSRYAAFDVTVWFQGRTRSYKSLFLFGTDGTEQKQIALDMITGVRNIQKDSLYPRVLLAPRYRTHEGVTEWLRSKESAECRSNEVCCDPETNKCTLPKDDIENKLANR